MGKDNPKTRTFIIDNQEKYDEIIVSDIDELQVDFTKQMLVVHTFIDEYVRVRTIETVEFENGNLTITYVLEHISGNVGSVCQPYQRWFIVKMDKLNCQTAKFVKK